MDGMPILNLIRRQRFVIFEHPSRIDQPLALGWRVGILAGGQFSLEIRNRSRVRQSQGIFGVVGGLHVERNGGGLRGSGLSHDITDGRSRRGVIWRDRGAGMWHDSSMVFKHAQQNRKEKQGAHE